MTLQPIPEAIAAATGKPFRPSGSSRIGGGCVHEAFRLSDGERSFFVKRNASSFLEMFAAESDALREMSEAMRVPEPVCHGTGEGFSFLVLEYLPMHPMDSRAQARLGQQLATLHRKTAPRFGWHRDNAIGATPQANGWLDDWPSFFAERRLAPQFRLAAEKGLEIPGWQDLCAGLKRFFPAHAPLPSLLHGDLWGGNAAMGEDGQPILFDPASYYGDRETDLAFTRMFGGFGASFYQAYEEAWPPGPGHAQREPLYNLYHTLNHFNLFGGSYGTQAIRLARSLP